MPPKIQRLLSIVSILQSSFPSIPTTGNRLIQIDPRAKFSDISVQDLKEAATGLLNGAPEKADQDLAALEESLPVDELTTLLIKELKIQEPAGFSGVLEREQYSILLRSLALLMAIADVLSSSPAALVHKRIQEILFQEHTGNQKRYVEERSSAAWDNLIEAYRLATEVQALHQELINALRLIKAAPTDKIDIHFFWDVWNTKRSIVSNIISPGLNGSSIMATTSLHRTTDRLPDEFGTTLTAIKNRVRS